MAKDYMVTSVTEQYMMDDSNKLQLYKVIYYKDAYDDTGTVRIPANKYAAELVDQLIEAEVAEHRKLHGIE